MAYWDDNNWVKILLDVIFFGAFCGGNIFGGRPSDGLRTAIDRPSERTKVVNPEREKKIVNRSLRLTLIGGCLITSGWDDVGLR